MAEIKTVTETLADMKNEVKWFRNAARRHALNANQTAVATTKIAELVQQEIHVQIGDKLAEWAERIETAKP